MEKDDKVSAATLPLGPVSTRTTSAGVELELSDEGLLRAVVGGASAMGTGTPHGSTDVPASELPEDAGHEAKGRAAKTDDAKTPKSTNNVRKIRIERMMSKAELARRANLSVLTIDRVERGYGCRVDTKRKILEALGLSLADRVRVFGEEE